MSTNVSNPKAHPSPAIDVTFSRIADQHGESSSQAGSRSSGNRSSREQRRSRDGTVTVPYTPEHHDGGSARRDRRSGGFLLDSAFGDSPSGEHEPADRHGKRKAQNGFLHVGKTRHAGSRLSADSSLGSSPLSREVSMDGAGSYEREAQRASRPVGMDPAQLVQMALELSESRKRHRSGSLQLPLSSPASRRSASGLASGLSSSYGTVRSRSPTAQRASYMSDESSKPRTSLTNDQTDKELLGYEDDLQEGQRGSFDQAFSPATISRAEKARRYFELASEHRRLLGQLPPLKPDSSAPGNYTIVSNSSPGSAHAQITRVPSFENNKHLLGRAYNPLQALRNRRLRARERRSLTAPPETWQDIERIKDWIDDVEHATQRANYRATVDRVHLPPYPGDDETKVDSFKGHRRTDTAGSVITRRENGWSIEPSELFADTYWTEKGDNKALIESRLGSPIFPAMARMSIDKPRKSEELLRNAVEDPKAESDTSDVPQHKRAHIRTHLLPRRHKRLTRSASTSSASSAEGRKPPALLYGSEGGDENIGPLERHMQEMIAKDQHGEPTSPEIVSPDRWDSQHTQFPILRDGPGRKRGNTLKRGDDGRLAVEPASRHRRTKSADGRVGGSQNAMSSVDDLDSAPQSPIVPRFVPVMGMDLSAPSNQRPTPIQRKSKLQKLPLFRERNNIERTDFATGLDNQPSIEQPRSSQDSARPSFIQRHKTTESISNTLRRHGTNATSTAEKDPGSGVGRLLRGGRIGELVRNEGSRLSDRLRTKERTDGEDVTPSGVLVNEPQSEDELDDSPLQPGSGGGTEPSPRTSMEQTRTKPRYYLSNLPSFRASAGRNKQTPVQTPMSTGSDPIGRQQRAQREGGRSARFDRLAPPRINLPGDDNVSESEATAENPLTLMDDRRKSYGFLESGSKSVSRTSLAFDDTANQRPIKTGSSPMRSAKQRHWSISDRLQPQQSTKVTVRDVARVRALLLSSGIKAREIQRQANAVRDVPWPVAEKAANLAGEDLGRPKKKEEHMVAARMLSKSLESSLSAFEKVITAFQHGTAKTLASQLDDLQRKAVDHLTILLHETADEAEAFNVELTTKGPQDVKRVDDGIDDVLRQRRRQFRLLRRAGFKLLEWLVLGIMWWVWFIVVIFNSVRKVIVRVLGFLKWLFWF